MDRKEFKQKPQHLVVDPRNGEIKRIIHPSQTEVGTPDFPADAKVFGELHVRSMKRIDGGDFHGEQLSLNISGSAGSQAEAIPTAFSGCQMWLEADARYVDLNTTAPVSVSRWIDISGNARDLTQPTKANQPRWNSENTFLGGMPSLEMLGAQVLSSSVMTLSTFTAIVGVQVKNNGGLIMEHSTNAGTTDGHWLLANSTGGNSSILVRRAGNNAARDMLTSSWAVDNGYPRMMIAQHGGDIKLLQIYVDNVYQRTSEVTGSTLGTRSTQNSLYLGARASLVAPVSGSYFALAVFSPAISPANAQKVARYFANKFNVLCS